MCHVLGLQKVYDQFDKPTQDQFNMIKHKLQIELNACREELDPEIMEVLTNEIKLLRQMD